MKKFVTIDWTMMGWRFEHWFSTLLIADHRIARRFQCRVNIPNSPSYIPWTHKQNLTVVVVSWTISKPTF